MKWSWWVSTKVRKLLSNNFEISERRSKLELDQRILTIGGPRADGWDELPTLHTRWPSDLKAKTPDYALATHAGSEENEQPCARNSNRCPSSNRALNVAVLFTWRWLNLSRIYKKPRFNHFVTCRDDYYDMFSGNSNWSTWQETHARNRRKKENCRAAKCTPPYK